MRALCLFASLAIGCGQPAADASTDDASAFSSSAGSEAPAPGREAHTHGADACPRAIDPGVGQAALAPARGGIRACLEERVAAGARLPDVVDLSMRFDSEGALVETRIAGHATDAILMECVGGALADVRVPPDPGGTCAMIGARIRVRGDDAAMATSRRCQGTIHPEPVRAAVGDAAGSLSRCYQELRSHAPTASGTIDAMMRFGPSGAVEEVTLDGGMSVDRPESDDRVAEVVERTEAALSRFNSCLAEVLQGISATPPEPAGSCAIVRIPLALGED